MPWHLWLVTLSRQSDYQASLNLQTHLFASLRLVQRMGQRLSPAMLLCKLLHIPKWRGKAALLERLVWSIRFFNVLSVGILKDSSLNNNFFF